MKLIALRDDILGGDYRCLYLTWLARKYDSNSFEKDNGASPPVPAGLQSLTAPLKVFAKFMYLEDDDLREAANLSVADCQRTQGLDRRPAGKS